MARKIRLQGVALRVLYCVEEETGDLGPQQVSDEAVLSPAQARVFDVDRSLDGLRAQLAEAEAATATPEPATEPAPRNRAERRTAARKS